MFFYFAQTILATPKVYEQGYMDIVIDKVRSGRIEIGFFSQAAPNYFNTISRGLKCFNGNYCFRGVNASNYIPNNSIAFGTIYQDVGDLKADYPTSPCDLPYMVCSVPQNGKTSGEMIITLKANADIPDDAVPVGRIISGKVILQKISEFIESGEDINKVRVCTCGVNHDKLDDYDL